MAVSLTKAPAPVIDRAKHGVITHYERTGEPVTLDLAPRMAHQWPGWEGQPLVRFVRPTEGKVGVTK